MNWPDFWQHVLTYLELAAAALAAGAAAGIPLGILASHRAFARSPVLIAANIGRVIPSLAVLTFMLPLFGIGFAPAVAALALLAIPPIVINTDLGFRAVPAAAVDAACGLGMTDSKVFARVEWPLAFPILFAGVRTAATEVIASAVLAAFIGAGGLGEYITTGLQANEPQLLFLGAGTIAAIALAAECALGSTQRRLEVTS
jgi:osmoprotectant transport system permease protein